MTTMLSGRSRGISSAAFATGTCFARQPTPMIAPVRHSKPGETEKPHRSPMYRANGSPRPQVAKRGRGFWLGLQLELEPAFELDRTASSALEELPERWIGDIEAAEIAACPLERVIRGCTDPEEHLFPDVESLAHPEGFADYMRTPHIRQVSRRCSRVERNAVLCQGLHGERRRVDRMEYQHRNPSCLAHRRASPGC